MMLINNNRNTIWVAVKFLAIDNSDIFWNSKQLYFKIGKSDFKWRSARKIPHLSSKFSFGSLTHLPCGGFFPTSMPLVFGKIIPFYFSQISWNFHIQNRNFLNSHKRFFWIVLVYKIPNNDFSSSFGRIYFTFSSCNFFDFQVEFASVKVQETEKNFHGAIICTSTGRTSLMSVQYVDNMMDQGKKYFKLS